MNDKFKSLQIVFVGFVCALILLLPTVGKATDYELKDRTILLPEELVGNQKETDHSGTVIQLLNNHFTLEGLTDRVDFYYQVPVQGVNKGSALQLSFEYSELLLTGSTITILIDDLPIHSKNINVNRNTMNMEIPLKGDMVTEGVHKLTVSFSGNILETLCTHEGNPASWLTINSESKLLLNTKKLSERENLLEDYPYPFVQPEQDEVVQSAIVIPNNASTSILSAAMKLANYLNSKAPEDETIPVIRESDLHDFATNMIAIGAEDTWTSVIKDLLTTVDLEISVNELTLSTYFLQHEENDKNQIMFITAQNDETIANKIPIVTNDSFIAQLSGDEISIDTLPTLREDDFEEDYTFSNLNIPSMTLTGKQKISQNYYVQLPTNIDLNEMTVLQLKMKVSNTLFQHEEIVMNRHQDAELVIYVNDIPHSIAINDLERHEEEEFYTIDLPIDAQQISDEAYVTIRFQANGLRDPDFCVPPNDEKWIFVHEDSQFIFPTVRMITEPNFKSWPAPFISQKGSSETVILLPDEYDQQTISQLYTLTNQLGNQSELDRLKLISSKDIDGEDLVDRHVIILGNLEHHEHLIKYSEDLIIHKNKANELNVAAFEFLNETAKYVAWVQPSVWDKSKSMVIFSSVQPGETNFLSKNLIDFMQTNSISTNIIVESVTGELFTHKLAESKVQDEEESVDHHKERDKDNNRLLIGGFIAILFISIIVFIFLYRKEKKAAK